METNSFSFNLPNELIASHPAEDRSSSRLLVCHKDKRIRLHTNFRRFPQIIPKNTMIILNNTRVRKARLFGESVNTTGKVEFLLITREDRDVWKCISSKQKKQHIGKKFRFPQGVTGEIIDRRENFILMKFSPPVDDNYLDANGTIPLPPYIKRKPTDKDNKNYQTVYGSINGSVAAPTAGLHFTDSIIQRLKEKGAPIFPVTLHVGIGTFQPVRADRIEDHEMHKEWYEVPEETANAINAYRRKGGGILAVGTTSARTLESAYRNGKVVSEKAATSLFIYPGYQFKIVDHLLTNFHTPKSTLIMLVCAFGGTDFILKSYEEAVMLKYRFYSYGDSMLIL